MNLPLTGFAAACYDTNSIAELQDALAQRSADADDCAAWGITPREWRAAIAAALAERLADAHG